MNTNNILQADVLDIIFDGKNKDYGAYELRKTYRKRLATAVSVMALVCLAFTVQSLLAGSRKPGSVITVIDTHLTDLRTDEPKQPPKPIEPPRSLQPAHRVQTIKNLVPVIVVDKDADAPVPEQTDLVDARIGTETTDGSKDDNFSAPPVETRGIGGAALPQKAADESEKIFRKVELEAKFPGGLAAWKRYLERNLNAALPAAEGAPEGIYTVTVQFIVDKAGNISNVTAVSIPKACPGCGPEAERVIRKGPKWNPAIQNGNPVNYVAMQNVSFQVLDGQD